MTKIVLFLALLVAGCRNDAPPAPTRAETAQLDDAEAMLNDLATNAEGPADRSAGPSNSN